VNKAKDYLPYTNGSMRHVQKDRRIFSKINKLDKMQNKYWLFLKKPSLGLIPFQKGKLFFILGTNIYFLGANMYILGANSDI